MEIQTIQKNIHTSPRKLRLVADLARKMTPVKAVVALQFTNKAAAADLAKAIKTAIANAKQQNIDPAKLSFDRLQIEEGPKMRRFRAGARGRVKPFKKRMSHIRIVLKEEENGQKS